MILEAFPHENDVVEFEGGLRLRFHPERRVIVGDSDSTYCEVTIEQEELWERGRLLLWAPPMAKVVVMMRRRARSLIRVDFGNEAWSAIQVARTYRSDYKGYEDFMEFPGGVLVVCEGGLTFLDSAGVVGWALTDLPADWYLHSVASDTLEVAGLNLDWGPIRYSTQSGKRIA